MPEEASPIVAPRVVAVIPCFNEAATISDLVRHCGEYAHQVIVVDDGSTDATACLAEEAGALVLRHPRNRGKGAAVTTALEKLQEVDAGIAVFLDGDGQHDPAQICRLVEPIQRGAADLVVGSRFLGRGNSVPRYRMLGQWVLTLACNLGSGVSLTDSQSGFRSLSREAIRRLRFTEMGLAVESEMQFRAAEQGLKVIEVPIQVHYRGKPKRNPARHGFGVLFRVLSLSLRRRLRRPAGHVRASQE